MESQDWHRKSNISCCQYAPAHAAKMFPRRFYIGVNALYFPASFALYPYNCGGTFLGLQPRKTRAEPSPAHTAKSRNSAYNYTRTLAAHRRGGALLHPKSLAGSQGLSGRAMLAPTIESQKSDIFLRKPCLLLVGACTAGPPTVRGNIWGFAAAANAGEAKPCPYCEIPKQRL